MIRTAVSILMFAVIPAAQASPRYTCVITPNATCTQQVPGSIVSDREVPTQNSFGPFVCSQFWGDGIMTASAFSSFGIVGVDIENRWLGCAAFGCGPSLMQINSRASHEFDVVFSSPTDDPIGVRMNLHLSGNIQEDPGLYRVVIAQVQVNQSAFSGRFGQIDQPDQPDIREGMFASFDEITGLDYASPVIANVPVNTPVRVTMSILVENASTLVTGGAVNFARGMRLQGTPFTVVETGPGVSPGDIVIDSPGANISGGSYGGAPCGVADTTPPYGQLNFFDVAEFITLFNAGDPRADLAEPIGTLDFFDIAAFIDAYNVGCP
tara:strand:- start:10209 stop:11177 length:969 start_codon:yes stop_codon:yes gene_type:complete